MLERLTPSEYDLAELFFKDFPINQPLLYSILDKECAGTVFTDDKNHPSFALVCSPAAYTYLAGRPSPQALKEIAAHLKTLPAVLLVCPYGWDYQSFFEHEGFAPVERLQLKRPISFPGLEDWKKRLPSQYTVDKIDARYFPKCIWHAFFSSLYGGDEPFYTFGKGVCLLDQGKVISESYGIKGRGNAEIAVITDEHYRGQNLGTIICAFMIEACKSQGLESFWSCNVHNPASSAIARKLGFVEDRQYFFLKRTSQ